jgi:hypothetical protein
MTQPAQSPLAFGAVRWAGRLFSYAGLATWFSYAVLLMSWAGHRPLRPDPPFILPFQDRGTLFVSLSDLRLSHGLLLVSGVLVALGMVFLWAERLWPEGRAAIAERRIEAHYRWIERQNARRSGVRRS